MRDRLVEVLHRKNPIESGLQFAPDAASISERRHTISSRPFAEAASRQKRQSGGPLAWPRTGRRVPGRSLLCAGYLNGGVSTGAAHTKTRFGRRPRRPKPGPSGPFRLRNCRCRPRRSIAAPAFAPYGRGFCVPSTRRPSILANLARFRQIRGSESISKPAASTRLSFGRGRAVPSARPADGGRTCVPRARTRRSAMGMDIRICRYYRPSAARSSSSVSTRTPFSTSSAAVTPSPGTTRPENVPS